jgi:hypothetical protein
MNLKDIFIDSVNSFLSDNGFVYDGVEPYFSKHLPQVVYAVVMNMNSTGNRHNIIPEILVRSVEAGEALENFHEIKYKGKYYFTVRSRQYYVANLYDRPAYKILNHIVKDETSLSVSLENFKSFMMEIGFSFFNRFKTLNDFDEWFNGALLKGEYNFKAGDPGGNAKEGLVAAKLNKNPRFEELYDLWIKGLMTEGKYDKTIATLKSLKTYLDNYRPLV